MNLVELNTARAADFVAILGGVYEHAAWVAEAVVHQRPFPSVDHLSAAMRRAVETAEPDRVRRLIEAHPDLAGKAARAGQVTASSAHEQESAGLDRLTDEEYALFQRQNAAYRARFGFPFILAVKGHTKTSILEAFERRLQNDATQERIEALRQIHRIAQLRLSELIPL